MKQRKSFGAALIALALLAALVTGCGLLGGGANPTALVGKWKLAGESKTGLFSGRGVDEAELFKDGTGVAAGAGFTWKVANNRLVITHPWFGLACGYKVSGSMVTLTLDDGGSGTFVKTGAPNKPSLPASFSDGEEYTVRVTYWDMTGVVTIRTEAGKIIMTTDLPLVDRLDNTCCPLLQDENSPSGMGFTVWGDGKTIIDGNTITMTEPGGRWIKYVKDGNTTTVTDRNGLNSIIVKNGNTTTETRPLPITTVKKGNTTTQTAPDGSLLSTTVKKGNTTTMTNHQTGRWEKRVVTRKGRETFVEVSSGSGKK